MDAHLRSQSVTLKRGQHIKYRPYAFTEHGILMLSSILNSERAVQVNIQIMRAFIRLRQMLATNANLERRLNELEKKYDAQFKVVFDAIRQLMALPPLSRKKIGFQLKERRAGYRKR
jgi:phage regulator Rha-like protein